VQRQDNTVYGHELYLSVAALWRVIGCAGMDGQHVSGRRIVRLVIDRDSYFRWKFVFWHIRDDVN
jgi:hypothetical protein